MKYPKVSAFIGLCLTAVCCDSLYHHHPRCMSFYVIANRPPFCFAAGSWAVVGEKKCFVFFLSLEWETIFFWFADCTYGGLICGFGLSVEKFPIELLLSVVEKTNKLLYKFALKYTDIADGFMRLLCLFVFWSPICSPSPGNVMVPSIPFDASDRVLSLCKAQVFGFSFILISFQGSGVY